MHISDIPLSIINRALELYGEAAQPSKELAWNRLNWAQGSKDIKPLVASNDSDLSPLALAIAECLSLSGPWAEGCEYDGECVSLSKV